MAFPSASNSCTSTAVEGVAARTVAVKAISSGVPTTKVWVSSSSDGSSVGDDGVGVGVGGGVGGGVGVGVGVAAGLTTAIALGDTAALSAEFASPGVPL